MTIDTDKAWDRLYLRLKEEDLLDAGANKTRTVSLIHKLQMAAAITVLCICTGVASLYFKMKNEDQTVVSIINSDSSNTLVSALEDGSIVYLASGAALSHPKRFAADKREVVLAGEALFDIKAKPHAPFLIDTELILVEVKGTKFNVKTSGKESFELSVQHGTVMVIVKSTGASEMVEDGETVGLHDGQLQKIASDDRSRFHQYTEKMQFKDERLENIVEVIGKISEKPVIITDNEIKAREITITFSNNTIEEMIELLCVGLNLTYIDNGDEFVITTNN